MVFDEWRNGILVAFVITARNKSTEAPTCHRGCALNNVKMTNEQAAWRPIAFILDDTKAEINSLR